MSQAGVAERRVRRAFVFAARGNATALAAALHVASDFFGQAAFLVVHLTGLVSSHLCSPGDPDRIM